MLLTLLRNWYVLASGFMNRKINTYANESAVTKKGARLSTLRVFVRDSLPKILRESRL